MELVLLNNYNMTCLQTEEFCFFLSIWGNGRSM